MAEQEEEEKLPALLVLQLLSQCELRDIAHAASVNRRWRTLASDDCLWRDLLRRDFSVASSEDHRGRPCSSFKEAYRKWHTSFQKYPSPLVVRTKQLWDCIQSWALANFPEVASSLIPGVSERELDDIESELGLNLPMPVRVLYRFFNGQTTPWSDSDEDLDPASPVSQKYFGLLGGYEFYNHAVNVFLLPLNQVLEVTQYVIPQWGLFEGSRRIIIAASHRFNKFFFLDCDDGSVYVGTKDRQMISCVPPSSDPSRQEDSFAPQDAMLQWLEEYCRQLQVGMFSVCRNDGICRISLFPEKEPLCMEAITCGVQVRCSAVFVPEASTLQKDDDKPYIFCYSVRMRLLPSGMGPSNHSFASCQLSHRHWIIRAEEGDPSEVHAEAVIGKYPLLQTGGETFVYASCSPLQSPSGSIEGGFTFVPGSLRKREGADFYAKAARFPLEVPQFIF